jgi:hypothetical protein
MPNKHFCQGPTCHEQPTTSRLQKSTGLLRTRYAQVPIDHDTDWNNLFKYFCSQGCANQWLNKNMACVEGRTVVPFTSHRKLVPTSMRIRVLNLDMESITIMR